VPTSPTGQAPGAAPEEIAAEHAAPAPPSTASRLRQTFIALEERDFRIFWLGQLVSVTGTWMQTVAQGWLVLQLTGSPFVLGLAAAARSVPVLLLAFPAGIVADRFDRRRIVIATNVVAAIASIVLGLLAITGQVTVPIILAIAAILGVTNAFEMPARQSYVSELIGRQHLANAIALNSLLFNSARVVGPALAGILVALVGPGGAFLLNGVSFVPVIVGLLLISTVYVPRTVGAARSALPEVLRYLRREPRVALLLGLLAAQTIFASGQFILGPALAEDLGQGAEGLGVLLSASGAGAVVGGIRLAATAQRSSRWRVLLGAGLALGGGLAAIGIAQSYAVTLLCLVVTGWGTVTFNASANTLIQSIVPDRLRGRVLSLYVLMLLGLMPVAGVLMGALATAVGSAEAIALGGVAYTLVIIAAFALAKPLRRL
jgi:MFS family permease